MNMASTWKEIFLIFKKSFKFLDFSICPNIIYKILIFLVVSRNTLIFQLERVFYSALIVDN